MLKDDKELDYKSISILLNWPYLLVLHERTRPWLYFIYIGHITIKSQYHFMRSLGHLAQMCFVLLSLISLNRQLFSWLAYEYDFLWLKVSISDDCWYLRFLFFPLYCFLCSWKYAWVGKQLMFFPWNSMVIRIQCKTNKYFGFVHMLEVGSFGI